MKRRGNEAHIVLIISSGSKCNESKCSESRRISRSSSEITSAPPLLPLTVRWEVYDGREDICGVSPNDTLDFREDDDESIAVESMERGRDRDGEKRSSSTSSGVGDGAW